MQCFDEARGITISTARCEFQVMARAFLMASVVLFCDLSIPCAFGSCSLCSVKLCLHLQSLRFPNNPAVCSWCEVVPWSGLQTPTYEEFSLDLENRPVWDDNSVEGTNGKFMQHVA